MRRCAWSKRWSGYPIFTLKNPAANARLAAKAAAGCIGSCIASNMGEGRPEDLDLLNRVTDNIMGRTICALADAASLPVRSFIKHFRSEFEYHIENMANAWLILQCSVCR
jgi:hypothetical protein